VTEITKTFAPNFRTILLVKLRNFMSRSIWLYALGSVVVAAGITLSNNQPLFSSLSEFYFSFLFLASIVISFSAMLFSSFLLVRSSKSDLTTVTFREQDLLVARTSGGPTVQHWDWIVSAEETRRSFYFTTRVFPRYELVLSKSTLSEEENLLLKTWLRKNVTHYRGWRPPGQPS
jgi:hypothetical protein